MAADDETPTPRESGTLNLAVGWTKDADDVAMRLSVLTAERQAAGKPEDLRAVFLLQRARDEAIHYSTTFRSWAVKPPPAETRGETGKAWLRFFSLAQAILRQRGG